MSTAYLGDFPDDGDPHEYMPAGAPCDERCFWCGTPPPADVEIRRQDHE